mmetsp:Transcript_28526/g.37990  ORF Transcript_28526/g.37990 Transcript_28526/m.37990 type:complete len:84 (+) Transcript_28526:1415-1666(+)
MFHPLAANQDMSIFRRMRFSRHMFRGKSFKGRWYIHSTMIQSTMKPPPTVMNSRRFHFNIFLIIKGGTGLVGIMCKLRNTFYL